MKRVYQRQAAELLSQRQANEVVEGDSLVLRDFRGILPECEREAKKKALFTPKDLVHDETFPLISYSASGMQEG
jgi:hypothetical protein